MTLPEKVSVPIESFTGVLVLLWLHWPPAHSLTKALCLITMAPVNAWDIWGSKRTVVTRNDLSNSNWRIVMARLNQSISKTAGFVGCSQFTVISIYQKWSKERQSVNWWRVLDQVMSPFCGDWRLAHQIPHWYCCSTNCWKFNFHQFNAGYDRHLPEHAVHHSLQHKGCQPVDWQNGSRCP